MGAIAQYFGILTMIDCEENMVWMGLIGLFMGVLLGALGYHVLKKVDI